MLRKSRLNLIRPHTALCLGIVVRNVNQATTVSTAFTIVPPTACAPVYVYLHSGPANTTTVLHLVDEFITIATKLGQAPYAQSTPTVVLDDPIWLD